MGGRRSSDEETVSLLRGGQRLSLYKSPEFFAVRFRGERIPETATGRLAAEVGLPATVRFVRRYSNRRTAIFHCHPADRDAVMDKLRSQKDAVHFVSHVLQRKRVNDLPGSEIGLDNKLFAEFRRSPSLPEIGQLQRHYGLRLIWRFPERPRATVFELTDTAVLNPLKISQRLMDTGRFRTVEPCLIEAKVGKAVPSDAGFPRQWHLLNVGQGGGLPGADCNAVAAWDHTWGRPEITLALIDDGFDLQHPDLSSPGKVRAPYDATQHDPNPSPETLKDNHGTACAGLAVAARGAGAAVGVAPDCTLMPIRHAGEVGDYDESLAFRHAFQNGADVISCSWGPPDAYVEALWPLPSLTRVQLEMCAREGRGGRGIPVFFAAGNGNESLELDGYASSDLVMAVAATTNRDEKAG
jgi:subtilisin family serine protease